MANLPPNSRAKVTADLHRADGNSRRLRTNRQHLQQHLRAEVDTEARRRLFHLPPSLSSSPHHRRLQSPTDTAEDPAPFHRHHLLVLHQADKVDTDRADPSVNKEEVTADPYLFPSLRHRLLRAAFTAAAALAEVVEEDTDRADRVKEQDLGADREAQTADMEAALFHLHHLLRL